MRIFYGVQGTGNGHITRARVMAKELHAAGIEVDFQFSGRKFDEYFDMEVFNGYQLRHGLTFAVDKGKVNYLKTAVTAKPVTFIKEVRELDLTGYDLIICDFEPVTAWAAKTRKLPVIGIGHQYAFRCKIPRQGGDPLAELVMRYFAPADIGIGLHWHHFGQPVLPPIIDTGEPPAPVKPNKIIVYLPFEETQTVIDFLAPFKTFEFHVYAPKPLLSPHDFIHVKPLSRPGFKKDLADSAGVISNAGFELASEALYQGKKILAKPLHAQMEQISNAAALDFLGFGTTMHNLESSVLESWLHSEHAMRLTYPNTAKLLVDWLLNGRPPMDTGYIENIWEKVAVEKIYHGKQMSGDFPEKAESLNLKPQTAFAT